MASLALAMLLSSMGTSIANVALPTLAVEFQASFQAVQWVVLAYLLSVTAVVVIAGRLADLLGRRRLMLAGIALFSISSLICAAAPGFELLVLSRASQGIGAALMMTLTMALAGEAVPRERMGRAMGLLGTTSAIGTALGPSVGGILIDQFGWQAIFLLNLPLGLLAAVLASRYLPRDMPRERERFDVPGATLLTFALVCYSLAMTLGHDHSPAINVALGGLSLLAVAVFLLVESRADSPLVRLNLFLDKRVSLGFATSFLATAVAMTTLIVGPFYLSGALHLDPARVGLVMSTGPLVAALAGLPAGKAVDRFGATRMSVIGLFAMALGAFLLANIAVEFETAGYILPLITLTAGFATFQAANNSAVVSNADTKQRGVISGLLNLSRNLGLVTGASLMGAIFMHFARTAAIQDASTEAVVNGTHAAFLVAAAFLCVAFVLMALSGLSPARDVVSRSQ